MREHGMRTLRRERRVDRRDEETGRGLAAALGNCAAFDEGS
jgi:hypothetical protein